MRSRVPPRLLVPILAALCCLGFLLGFLWWQLATTREALTERMHRLLTPTTHQTATGSAVPAIPDVTDSGDSALLHLRRGDLLTLKGQWMEARTEYSQAVDAGGGLTALRKLEQAQLQVRDIPAARATLEKLRRAGARSEDLLLVESIILLRTGELVKAGQMLAAAPDSPQQHYGLSLLSLMQGNHDETKKQLASVIGGWEPVLRSYARTLQSAYDEYALFPSSPQTHLDALLAQALAQVHECEIALPILSRVTTTQDDYRDAWIVRGYCELTTERSREAVASFERAYNIDPEKPEIQYFLGRSYAAVDDTQNAITFLQYALRNGFQPEADVRAWLTKEAVKIGNSQLALDQSDAITKLPNATIAAYSDFVSLALTLARPQDALLKAVEATKKWPEDPKAYELLGDAAISAGNKEDAKKAYGTALQKDPNNASVKGKMEKL